MRRRRLPQRPRRALRPPRSDALNRRLPAGSVSGRLSLVSASGRATPGFPGPPFCAYGAKGAVRFRAIDGQHDALNEKWLLILRIELLRGSRSCLLFVRRLMIRIIASSSMSCGMTMKRKKITAAICGALLALMPVSGVFATTLPNVNGGKWMYGAQPKHAWSSYYHPTRRHSSSLQDGIGRAAFSGPKPAKKWSEANLEWWIGRMHYYYRLL